MSKWRSKALELFPEMHASILRARDAREDWRGLQREFRRLTRTEAQRLAATKGLVLPEQHDFSLAELYCGAVGGPVFNADRQMGFAQ